MNSELPELPWHEVTAKAEPCVFRIYAGDSAGTCFAFYVKDDPERRETHTLFVTAWHVVKVASETGKPLEIVSADRKHRFSSSRNSIRFFRLGKEFFDTALLDVITDGLIVPPSRILPTAPRNDLFVRGVDLGWLGFPGLVEPELCFFHGHVSGYLGDPPAYLVDGVAIHGVSGGPAIDNRAHITGFVSAYIPNKVNESTVLPGLMTLIPIGPVRQYVEEELEAIDF